MPVLPDPGLRVRQASGGAGRDRSQNDFLSPDGAGWPVFGQSVTENNTVANLTRLFEAAESSGMTVAVSPHYEFQLTGMAIRGAGEQLIQALHMFERWGH